MNKTCNAEHRMKRSKQDTMYIMFENTKALFLGHCQNQIVIVVKLIEIMYILGSVLSRRQVYSSSPMFITTTTNKYDNCAKILVGKVKMVA